MCGIAGFFRPDGGEVDGAMLRRMAGALAHRGPDGERIHLEPGLGLAHRRLSVIDLEGGAQPMSSVAGACTVVFNGEIYNYQSLRAGLAARGHPFRTRSDTEIILAGWQEWGEGVVDHLEGMFAIALWDRARRTLFLARDRLGKKPLHYATVAGGVAFASEIAALRTIDELDSAIDPAALTDYLALGYVPDPATIFRSIRRLPPGHTWLLSAGAVPATRQTWRPRLAAPPADAEEAAETLRAMLLRATDARLVADVPLGAFLSGGLDSASVVAAAMRAARRGAAPLGCFTIGFAGKDDESEAAAAIARHCGAVHQVERSAAFDWIEAAASVGRVFGEPFGDSSAVPGEAVCRAARCHVTVALSGDGGDEAFGGYRRHRWHLLVEAARRHLPAALRRGPVAALARLYPKLDRAPRFLRARHTLTELGLSSALGYYSTMARLDADRLRALLHPSRRQVLDGYDPAARFVALMDEQDGRDPLAQAQMVDLATWLPGRMLTKVDRTSMRHGLEVRSPLLDPAIVEWGIGLPAAMKISRGRGKATLRAAAAPWLPEHILARPKQGFAISLDAPLRAGMARIRGRLFSPAFLDARLVCPDGVGRMLDQHEGGAFDHGQPIWQLLVLAGFVETELCGR